jgi:hypothetical protein
MNTGNQAWNVPALGRLFALNAVDPAKSMPKNSTRLDLTA